MLIFVDEAKNVRVVRRTDADGVRTPLGKISKTTFELTDELGSKLAEDETAEVKSLIDYSKAAIAEKRRASAANYPSTTRDAVDFYMNEAGQLERKLILGAVMEALRQIRKFEKVDAGA